MSLSLPADLEVFGDYEQFHDPGVYALVLDRPDDLGAAWDRHFETRPDWLEAVEAASALWYVGASGDILSRLEDHRDGEVRQTALTQVCSIDDLRNVWWFEDADRAFERESALAIELSKHYPDTYVHQR